MSLLKYILLTLLLYILLTNMFIIVEPMKNCIKYKKSVKKSMKNINGIKDITKSIINKIKKLRIDIKNNKKQTTSLYRELNKGGKLKNTENKGKFEKTGEKITPSKIKAAKSMM